MSAPAFSLHRVAKTVSGRSGPVPVLGGVSLDVAAGELLAVVGPSGCGKSTLADLLAGRSEPTAGRLLADGAPLAGPGPDRVLVGRQDELLPWRTVAGNVAFGLEGGALGAEERGRAVDDALSLLNLSALAGRRPYELDDADRLRVALARSVARDPAALILDEPFAALDAVARGALQEDLLRVWAKTGTTMVFFTHSAEEAIYLGRRVAVLTRRPAEVKSLIEIEIGLDERLPGCAVRSTPCFTAYRNRVWDELYDAVPPPAAASGTGRERQPAGIC